MYECMTRKTWLLNEFHGLYFPKNCLGELSNSSSRMMTYDCFRGLSSNSPQRVVQYNFIGKLVLCFQEQKHFVLKTVFLTLGLGMCEGVSEGSRCGGRCITFSSITCRHLSRDLYVLLECLACLCMST